MGKKDPNEKGVKAPPSGRSREKKEISVPDYFLKALRKNQDALSTFEKLSYSHKKEYVEWITEAKTEPTREKRIRTAIEWISEGKN